MRAVKSENTSAEMRIRRIVHGMGYRYSLHSKSLPGKPDIVFSSRRKIIFVHGCFWHNHKCRHGSVVPLNNRDYWRAKREKNEERDKNNLIALRKLGWQVLVVWECSIRDLQSLRGKLDIFLRADHITKGTK